MSIEVTSFPLIPGNEIVGYGVNVVGAAFATTEVPVGGLKERIFDLGPAQDGQEWLFHPSKTTYIVPPGLEMPGPGMLSVRALAGSSKREFTKQFGIHAGISGSYYGFSGQVNAVYQGAFSDDQEYSYACIIQTGLTWSISKSDHAVVRDVFKAAIKLLPDSFDPLDVNSAPFYYGLFDTWGTHFVNSAHVGGRLYYYAAVDKSYSLSTETIQTNISAEWKGLVADVQADSQAEWENTTQNWAESRETFLISVGPGSQEIDVQQFITPDNFEWLGEDNIITTWQESVNNGPGSIGATFSPITDALLSIEITDEKKQGIGKALEYYLSKGLNVRTVTGNSFGAGNQVSVLLDDGPVAFENQPSPASLCGLVAVIIDRSNLKEIYLAKFYEATDVNNGTIRNWDFQIDFKKDVRNTIKAHPSFIIVIATYGLDAEEACPANGDQAFGQDMLSWGGGAGLEAWLDVGPSGYISAPSGETPQFGYILVGANNLGAGAGVEIIEQGGVELDATYVCQADAQLRPGINTEGNTMIFTPAIA